MKKIVIMAAVAFAAFATPAMAQPRTKVKQDGTTERMVQGPNDKAGKRMKDPKKRTARMAEKLNFTDAQKAQLDQLNAKYPGAEFDRKAYREGFRAILTDAQKQKMAEWKAKHKEKHGQRGEMKKA
ncbi:MAG: hypothetical protein EOP56_07190 [Sphingobacteriales bacterium]|nr:MAG: hypothetical protein EOP56_07190 [Sphingobacteriales bacterium]